MSAPKGNPTSPHGYWSVIGFIDGDILAAKEKTTIRVSPLDVQRVAAFDMERLRNAIFAPRSWERKKLSVKKQLMNIFDLTQEQVDKIIISHCIPPYVSTDEELQYVEQLVRRVINEQKGQ